MYIHVHIYTYIHIYVCIYIRKYVLYIRKYVLYVYTYMLLWEADGHGLSVCVREYVYVCVIGMA
jgi:hypothetical protein